MPAREDHTYKEEGIVQQRQPLEESYGVGLSGTIRAEDKDPGAMYQKGDPQSSTHDSAGVNLELSGESTQTSKNGASLLPPGKAISTQSIRSSAGPDYQAPPAYETPEYEQPEYAEVDYGVADPRGDNLYAAYDDIAIPTPTTKAEPGDDIAISMYDEAGETTKAVPDGAGSSTQIVEADHELPTLQQSPTSQLIGNRAPEVGSTSNKQPELDVVHLNAAGIAELPAGEDDSYENHKIEQQRKQSEEQSEDDSLYGVVLSGTSGKPEALRQTSNL